MGSNPRRSGSFSFKRFDVSDSHCGMKVGTDSVLLGAWAELPASGHIVDAGAGCGILALMAAQRCGAEITAVEIDPDAAGDAAANFAASPWASRLTVVKDDFEAFATSDDHRKADLIISNPPFYNADVKAPDAVRNLARHGDRGFDVISLVKSAPSLLAPGGSVAFVAPVARYDDILFQASLSRLHLRRLAAVRQRSAAQPVRHLWQLSTVDGPTVAEEITIRDEDNRFTKRYAELTGDFYLNVSPDK